MTDLASKPGEVHFTLQITRAATGLVETIPMVGHIVNPADVPAEVIETQPIIESKEI